MRGASIEIFAAVLRCDAASGMAKERARMMLASMGFLGSAFE